MMHIWIYFLFSIFLVTVTYGRNRELILISAPSKYNSYYKDRFAEIINFQINFANSIAGKNDVIVLADRDTLPYLTGDHPNVIANRLLRDRVMQANVDDIWIRDFGTVRQTSPVLLGYAPGYLNRRTAKSIKNSFVAFLKSAGINVAQMTAPNNNGLALTYFSDLAVDGGNVVDDMQTTAILTDRSFLENPQYANDKDRFKADLRKALGYPNITLISQYGDKDADTTGHSDGMVSFLDANTLAYSRMEKDKLDKMLRELRAGLGTRTKFVELPSYYVDETDYHGFSSACGLHINSLVTKDYVYMPVFGHDPEAQRRGYSVANDDLVYGIIRQNTRKQVVRVPVPYKVCILGGSVRCLSMQIEGPVADRLLSLVSGNNAG